jgi:hypothetical protein
MALPAISADIARLTDFVLARIDTQQGNADLDRHPALPVELVSVDVWIHLKTSESREHTPCPAIDCLRPSPSVLHCVRHWVDG